MAIITKEEMINKIKETVTDNTSDSAISLIEDISDTMDSLNGKDDWKTKYEENDAMWRKKYTERFYAGSDEPEKEKPETYKDENEDKKNQKPKVLTYEALFEKK